MGLYDKEFGQVDQFLNLCKKGGKVQNLSFNKEKDWPTKSTLILEENTAVELGNPKHGSLFFLVWTENSLIEKDQIALIGNDISHIKKGSVPFAQILQVQGSFEKGLEYERHLEIKRAVYETSLDGFMVRSMPSRQSQWCRVSKGAVDNGFSFAHLGRALIQKVKSFDFVKAVRVIFIAGNYDDVIALKPTGEQVSLITGALIKLNEQGTDHSDCASCEFWDVCQSVEELRRIRNEKPKGAEK